MRSFIVVLRREICLIGSWDLFRHARWWQWRYFRWSIWRYILCLGWMLRYGRVLLLIFHHLSNPKLLLVLATWCKLKVFLINGNFFWSRCMIWWVMPRSRHPITSTRGRNLVLNNGKKTATTCSSSSMEVNIHFYSLINN